MRSGEFRLSILRRNTRGCLSPPSLRQCGPGIVKSRRQPCVMSTRSSQEKQAQMIRKPISKRLRECGLELHPEKTRIIYCKDDLRKGRHTDEKIDFLGYEFRPRESINRNGTVFTNFSPAVSTKAAKSMREVIRSWRLRHCSHQSLDDLSRLYNPIVRGWFQYYGRYYRRGLYSVIRQLDRELGKWARQKYKKLRNHVRHARQWVAAVSRRSPHLFAHWTMKCGGSLMGAV